MKVIIDISEDVYEECQGHIYFPDTGGELFNAVKNGTPLSKGHGKIIDVNEAINYIDDYALGFFGFDGVPAIIEADTESEEKYHA